MGETSSKMPSDGVGAHTSVLYAASTQIGTACSKVNADFLACKNKDANPSACLAQGTAATECARDLLQRMSASCGPSLDGYSGCLEKHGMEFRKCRSEQAAFEACSKQ